MNTTKFSRIVLSMVLLVALAVTSLVMADNVQNDVVSGGNDTITAGGSTTINYHITANNGDGQTGCNAADVTPATVTINTPAGVTATPASLSFTSCGTDKPVEFSATVADNYEITVSVSDSGTGSYNTNPAKFTLHVIAPPPPANTAPSVSVAGVGNGAIYEIGSVPAATCEVTDAEDGNSSFAATLSAVTGPLASYGVGSQTASCSYTDNGGLTASASVTYSIVDTTDPEITYISRTPANNNGWNNSDVTVNWTCSDSGSDVFDASVSQTVSTEGTNQSATGTCTDNAGNTASDIQTGINIDKTAPTASASASPAANANGWSNTDVTVAFSGTDGLSGIDFCSLSALLSSEGAGQSASGTCTDKAGNTSAQAMASGINIDKTAPSVSLVGGPADGASYYFGSVPAAPTCSASDALSGLDGACSVSGYGATVGSHTVTASAKDKAGNSASTSASYTVLAWTLNGFFQPVDMGGVVNTVKGGSTVPLKFEVFAGSTELTSTEAVKSFTAAKISCTASSAEDAVEFTTTGGTSLRYDATGGQFIQNWKTPTGAGTCYKVTLTTQDGSTISANFKLK